MFVDACAIVALLADEPEAASYAAALDESPSAPWTSALAVFEAILVLARPSQLDLDYAQTQAVVVCFLKRRSIALRELGDPEAVLNNAVAVADRHGAGRKSLNIPDCFHYASAKTTGSPMLTLDRLLRDTDVPTLP